MALSGQNSRLEALMDYYAGLDPAQFEEEAGKLDDLPWSERIMVGYLLFARWGEEDPEAAKSYLETTEALSQESKDRIKRWGSGGGRGRGR